MTIFSKAQSEQFGFAESQSEAATFPATMAEAIGMAETQSETAIFAETMAEAIGLAETQSESAIFPDTLAEAIGLADTVSSIGIYPETMAEAVGMAEGQQGAMLISDNKQDGYHRLAQTTLARWDIYKGEDASPSVGLGATAWETFTSSPHTTAALTVGVTTNLVVRLRNIHNLESLNIDEFTITLDGAGAQITNPPSNPFNISILAAANGNVRILASYDAATDGTTNQGTRWDVWLTTDGSTPDISDVYGTQPTIGGNAVEQLDLTTTDNFADGLTAKVIVKVTRTSDSVSSDDATVNSVTTNTDGPGTTASSQFTIGGRADA